MFIILSMCAFVICVTIFIMIMSYLTDPVQILVHRIHTTSDRSYDKPDSRKIKRDVHYKLDGKKIYLTKCFVGYVTDFKRCMKEFGFKDNTCMYVFGRHFEMAHLLTAKNKFVVVQPLHDLSATAPVDAFQENYLLRKCIGIVNIEHTSTEYNITTDFDLPSDISTEEFSQLLNPYLKSYSQTLIATLHMMDDKYVVEVYPLKNIISIIDKALPKSDGELYII